MAQRYFNWTLAVVLVVATAVLAVAVVALHGWQKSNRADQALPLGERAYAEGDWEEAASQLGRYLAIYGDDVEVLLKYADAQLKIRPSNSNSLQQAEAAYSAVLRLDRTNSEAAHRLIELYLATERFDLAESKAKQYLESKEDDPVVRRLLGAALSSQRRFSEAAATLTSLIEDHPDEVLAYETMGALAESRPDDVNRPAAYWYDEAVTRNPNSALAYTVRAGFRVRSRDPNGAMADLGQAETLDLSDARVRLRLIAGLIDLRAWDEARVHLKALQAEVPTEQRLWQSWAQVAWRSGSAEEMQTVAETGLKELAAQPWDFMPLAAELFIRAGRSDRAGECVARMRQKGVMPDVSAFLDGRLAEQEGRLQDAVSDWERAISLGYHDALVSYGAPPARVAMAMAYSRLGEVQSAIGQMRALVSEVPDYAYGHLFLAQLLAQARDWSAVVEQARQVQRLSPGNVEAALQELQARIQLRATGGTPLTGPEGTWQDIEDRLARLNERTNGAFQVGALQVRAAMAQGKFAEADALLNKLSGDHPTQPDMPLLRAELRRVEAESYRSQGQEQQADEKEQQAVSLLRQAVAESPQKMELVRNLALLLNRQGKTEECESVITQAVARLESPQSRRDLGLLLAQLYTSWKQTDKLHQWLTDLARQFPNDIQTKRRLLALEVVQDQQKAQRLVDEIRSIEGENGWQWRLEQARVWVHSEDFSDRYAQIVRLLQQNLLANPQDLDSRLLLATAHEKAGETQLALAVYRELLNRAPDDIRIIIRVVDALSQAGEAEEARRILEEADQRDLYHPDLRRLQLLEDLRLSGTASDSEVRRSALASAFNILEELVQQDPNDTTARLRLALVLTAQGKFDEAQALLDDLKAADPQSLPTAIAQIQLDVRRGNTAQAIQLCDEIVGRLKNATAHVLRARTYVALNEPDKALDDFTRALDLEPERTDLWLARAGFYQTQGRLNDAIADAQKALALAPHDLTVQQFAIVLLMTSPDRAVVRRAEKVLDDALNANPEDANLKLFKARVLLRKRMVQTTEQARRLLTDLTEDQPGLVEAWELLGRLELQEDQPGRAVDVALRGLVENPDNRRLLFLKAEAEGRRSPVLAIPTLKVLADQDPKDADVIAQLAYAYVESGRAQRALELLRERLSDLDGAGRRRCEIALARTLYRSGDRDNAQALFDRLMQAEPDDPTPVLTLAGLLRSEENWPRLKQLVTEWSTRHAGDVATPWAVIDMLFRGDDEQAGQTAEELLRATLERHPDSVGLLSMLAIRLQTTGRNEESARLNRKILELDPNDAVAINNLAWFLCEQQGRYQEALELADRGLALVPGYLDLLDTRGVVHYRMQQYEAAVRDLSRCVEQYPANAPALAASRFNLARAYAEMGRRGEAVEQLRQSLALQSRVGGLTTANLAEAERLLAQLEEAD